MKSELKKPYTKPQLITHGDVEKLTLAGRQANADVPGGANGTAFSPS